jgi:oligopeptide/dipeptide ABC transporter ATP-binding protein
MRQRVMIAIVLALAPEVLIADEPTTALDVTVQAEIMALVRELQAERGLVVVWITHDMGVVAEIADEVAVMYGGRIVEHAPVRELFARPLHPYTQALIASAREDPDAPPKAPFATIPGQPPTGEVPPGCPFHPRCPVAVARCATDLPPIRELREGHAVACHLAE